MSTAESSDINLEWKLVAIGRGSFATVSILLGRPVAFKHVLASQRTPELKAEFEALLAIYDFFSNADSFFLIPRPLAYYDPSISTSFTSPEATHPGRASRARRPLVTEGDFEALNLSNAAYAMDQVLPLPLQIARVIRSLFYPPTGRDSAPVPTLCRLYFGKSIESSKRRRPTTAFFNSANFPLDLARYEQVRAAVPDDDAGLPTPEEISRGMGETLGRLHWGAGYDGRDVEFVLGGMSFSGVETYVIDFNQMRAWKRNKDEIQQLVDSFFINDPYYPRPRANDRLYQHFCAGYKAAHPSESNGAVEIAGEFLRAIEAEQAKRDARKAQNLD